MGSGPREGQTVVTDGSDGSVHHLVRDEPPSVFLMMEWLFFLVEITRTFVRGSEHFSMHRLLGCPHGAA